MEKHRELTEKRIATFINRQIKPLIYGPGIPLDITVHHVHGEPITWEAVQTRSFDPFTCGEKWGSAWDTTWFCFKGQIPADWSGSKVVALIDLGFQFHYEGFTCEGLIWQDGVPRGAINVNRQDVSICENAKGNELVSFYVEAAANPTPAMSHGETLAAPDYFGKPIFTLQRAELVQVNELLLGFYYTLQFLYEAMLALPQQAPRRCQLLYALNQVVNLLQVIDNKNIEAAIHLLQPHLDRTNSSSAHRISAIGHAHIDSAWLWPVRETIRKCARTFSTALMYMKEFPHYRFGCSQAQQYEWMRLHYPQVFEAMKQAVSRGQWEPIGSMWVEADCNIPSGESLIRQIMFGKSFFRKHFGIDTVDLWLPDVFGYSAALPQILKKCGIRYFMTTKLSWNQFNQFPFHTFLWKGIDGSTVFTHLPPSHDYNSDMSPKTLVASVEQFTELDRSNRSLYIFGFGDGGGGPTRQQLQWADFMQDFEGLPKVTQETVRSFFCNARAESKDLPVWIGELYFELHRGTYTTQARNKRANRKCEYLLREAEFSEVLGKTGTYLAQPEHSSSIDAAQQQAHPTLSESLPDKTLKPLEQAWKLLLLNQFHDIIPGSSINRVYEESQIEYSQIETIAETHISKCLQSLLCSVDTSGLIQPYLVVNSLSHRRRELISVAGGKSLYVDVPACGYTVVDGGQQSDTSQLIDLQGLTPVMVKHQDQNIIIKNGFLTIQIDAQGLITRIYDRRQRREVIPPGEKANLFQLHNDFPNRWDAWDIDIFYKETVQNITSLDNITVKAETPYEAVISIERSFGNSKVLQDIIIHAGSARIDFKTHVNWHEKHKLLKVAFPVSIHSHKARYEIQFGHIERPNHYNTSWDLARFEVSAHKWADLSETDYGVALLNDCKYGYDILGNVMRLSLLRAPTAPDPLADQGEHDFTYALYPHLSCCPLGEVIEQGYNLNAPLRTYPLAIQHGALPRNLSLFSINKPGIVIETIKVAEQGNAIIIRYYEAYGRHCQFTFASKIPIQRAFKTDLLEDPYQQLPVKHNQITLHCKPFEIQTIKLVVE